MVTAAGAAAATARAACRVDPAAAPRGGGGRGTGLVAKGGEVALDEAGASRQEQLGHGGEALMVHGAPAVLG